MCEENDVCKFSNFLSRSTLKILLPSYDNCTLKLKTKLHILGLIHLPFPIPLTSLYVKVKKQNECIHTLLVLIQITGADFHILIWGGGVEKYLGGCFFIKIDTVAFK